MRRASPLLAAMLLTGCAAASQSPSLAPRPIEQRFLTPDAPPVPPPPPAPADASLAARIGTLMTQLRAGDAAFAAALPEAERAVAHAGSAQSESWIAAQQRLSVLEAARGPSTLALGELDALLIGQIASGQPGAAEIQSAHAEADRVVGAQHQRIDSLRSRLTP